MSDFTQLNVHTCYSLKTGICQIGALVQKACAMCIKAVSITDRNNLYGVPCFYFRCKDYGIKPIIGCEISVSPDEARKNSQGIDYLILLATNHAGYHNLIKLLSIGYDTGNPTSPFIPASLLTKYSDGLIAISGNGTLLKAIMANDMDLAAKYILKYADAFQDRFYLGLQRLGRKDESSFNQKIMELAEGLFIPVVATNSCCFIEKDDIDILKILKRGNFDDVLSPDKITSEQYFKGPNEMEKLFSDIPEAIANACEIAESCHVELDTTRKCFPVPTPCSKTGIEEALAKLAENGLANMLAAKDDKGSTRYWNRLAHELAVINATGFASYFLVAHEFVTWAKSRCIAIGPGRGSAVCSLVAYALEITKIDPLLYDLPFERFLNPERVSPPDIDVDVSSRRRAEIIEHLKSVYGHDCVSKVAAFGKIRAKKAVRIADAWLGMQSSEISQITKSFLDKPDASLSAAIQRYSSLRAQYETQEQIRKLLDMAIRLEGIVDCTSTHASAVIISTKPLNEQIPLCIGKTGETFAQFEAKMLEKLGYVKIDILGLAALDFIDDILQAINANGKDIPDLTNLPLDDKQTYNLYSSGDLTGIFHMKKPAICSHMVKLKPDNFNDLIIMLALNRPGPLASGMMKEFIKRRHGNVQITYPHKLLEECLKETLGLIVYQEQVMQTAQIIAGFSLGEADLLRMAISKKDADKMVQEKSRFLCGATKNGISTEDAINIFNLIEKFAGYGLNKGHSVAYAHISYQTAWLKAHFPDEFKAVSALKNSQKLALD